MSHFFAFWTEQTMGKCLDICPRKGDLMQNHNCRFDTYISKAPTGQVYSPKHFQSSTQNNKYLCIHHLKLKKLMVNFQNLYIMLGKIGNLFGSKQELGNTDYTLS